MPRCSHTLPIRDCGDQDSDAVAALIGALAVVGAANGAKLRFKWPSQVYSVFFATYLTGLAVGAILPSIIAGDMAVVAYAIARRSCRPATVRCGCLVLIVACGAVMTVMRQGHGLGFMFGVVISGAWLTRSRIDDWLGHARAPDGEPDAGR
jgi:hypothetical protein